MTNYASMEFVTLFCCVTITWLSGTNGARFDIVKILMFKRNCGFNTLSKLSLACILYIIPTDKITKGCCFLT